MAPKIRNSDSPVGVDEVAPQVSEASFAENSYSEENDDIYGSLISDAEEESPVVYLSPSKQVRREARQQEQAKARQASSALIRKVHTQRQPTQRNRSKAPQQLGRVVSRRKLIRQASVGNKKECTSEEQGESANRDAFHPRRGMSHRRLRTSSVRENPLEELCEKGQHDFQPEHTLSSAPGTQRPGPLTTRSDVLDKVSQSPQKLSRSRNGSLSKAGRGKSFSEYGSTEKSSEGRRRKLTSNSGMKSKSTIK